MTPKDKRDYLNLLIKAIADHDGAVCWEMETGRTVYYTPSWAYIADLPDDGAFHITFDWVEDDRGRAVRTMFFHSFQILLSKVA